MTMKRNLDVRHPGERAIAQADLRDELEDSRKAQKKTKWAVLIPGIGATATFGVMAFLAHTPEPSLALVALFGIGTLNGLRHYLRLGKERRVLEDGLEDLEVLEGSLEP